MVAADAVEVGLEVGLRVGHARRNTGEAVDEEVALTCEHLDGMAHLLASLAWVCRLDARQPGSLKAWLTRLNQMNIPLQGPLSYLLQVGEAIFSFYLVLWELVLMADGGSATAPTPNPANQAAQFGRTRLRASR